MPYPRKLCVISPHIVSLPMRFGRQWHDRRLVFLRAFAALVIRQADDGQFAFEEVYRHDQHGNGSVEQLIELCTLLREHDMTVAALGLRDLARSFVQVPKGSNLEIPGKASLMYFRDALLRPSIEAADLDEQGGIPSLMRAALSNDLVAEWDKPGADYNHVRLRAQLTARTQSIWLAIAEDQMSSAEFGQATQKFLTWKEEQLID